MKLLIKSTVPVTNKLLYYLSVISEENALVYEQFFDEEKVDEELTNSINNIALGLKNTMNVVLTSINYLDNTIYFRRGINFIVILITTGSKQLDELVGNLFDSFQKDNILDEFSELASLGVISEIEDLQNRIAKIVNNMTFFFEVNDLRKGITY